MPLQVARRQTWRDDSIEANLMVFYFFCNDDRHYPGTHQCELLNCDIVQMASVDADHWSLGSGPGRADHSPCVVLLRL